VSFKCAAAALQRQLAAVTRLHRDGWTLLHFSAYKNHLEMTKVLLEHGADVNTKEENEYELHVQLLRCTGSWLLRHKAVQLGDALAQGR
jgi:ankyrin repeat protein